ncbi:MAG: hypothetical protein CFE37_00120 [Alphaproteobacteria bacterium PA4]|nr:MAG: hypothetical protein CFE37_00120 [Alphaproteobacteria bacterium PA4]
MGAALALVGCARTSKGYREQAPRLELFSGKAPSGVLGCINEAWQRQGSTTQYTPLPTGGTVAVALPTLLLSTGNLQMFVDAELVDGKTRVRFYRMAGLRANDYRGVEDQIRRCL